MDNNACTLCAIHDGAGCNLGLTYAVKPNDLTCPYFLTKKDAPQKCQQCEELANALEKLEWLSGASMMRDIPVRVDARKALANYRGES